MTVVLTVLAVLFVGAVAVAFLVLLTQDLRATRRRDREPLDPDARRSLAAHEQVAGQRRLRDNVAPGWRGGRTP